MQSTGGNIAAPLTVYTVTAHCLSSESQWTVRLRFTPEEIEMLRAAEKIGLKRRAMVSHHGEPAIRYTLRLEER